MKAFVRIIYWIFQGEKVAREIGVDAGAENSLSVYCVHKDFIYFGR